MKFPFYDNLHSFTKMLENCRLKHGICHELIQLPKTFNATCNMYVYITVNTQMVDEGGCGYLTTDLPPPLLSFATSQSPPSSLNLPLLLSLLFFM